MATSATQDLDAVFFALADATRRAIVERLLRAGELSAGNIARPFQISSPAISRHLRVLEEAGIIERRVDRQWRYVRLQLQALAVAETWLAGQHQDGIGAREGSTKSAGATLDGASAPGP